MIGESDHNLRILFERSIPEHWYPTQAAAHASGAANAELLESCGCRWKAEVGLRR